MKEITLNDLSVDEVIQRITAHACVTSVGLGFEPSVRSATMLLELLGAIRGTEIRLNYKMTTLT